jgi:hypothetical protein
MNRFMNYSKQRRLVEWQLTNKQVQMKIHHKLGMKQIRIILLYCLTSFTCSAYAISSASEDNQSVGEGFHVRVFGCEIIIPNSYTLDTREYERFLFTKRADYGIGSISIRKYDKSIENSSFFNIASVETVSGLKVFNIESKTLQTHLGTPLKSIAITDGKTGLSIVGDDVTSWRKIFSSCKRN